nr:hypothetical protein [uncultured Halomonas sp.]
MAAIDYLKAHELYVEARRDGRITVWPKHNITPQIRAWIKQHKNQLLLELKPKGSLNVWRIRIDGKPATMLSLCSTQDEALQSVRGRWPAAYIEILTGG